MDAQHLLGSLVMGALGGRPLRRDARVALGLGAVALAAAAWEHYSEQRQRQQPPPPPAAPQRGEVPPPQPPRPSSAAALGPPAAPAAAPAAPTPSHADAVLLIQAMIAAASADGVIDAAERQTIMERVAAAGLGESERSFLEGELSTPPRIEEIVAKVASPALAEEVYAVSLLATRPDTDVERAYLADLAARLALPAATVERVNEVFGVAAGGR
jgi:uncharacterized membrane protein YebE (DUF533 family)